MTDLWSTLDFFQEGKQWTKGFLYHNQQACLLGGLQCAKGVNLDMNYEYPAQDDLDMIELSSVIQEQFPDRVKGVEHDALSCVVEFNDHNDTVYDEVRMVAQKAAIRRDEVLS